MAATNLYIVQTKIRNNFSDHRIFSDVEDARKFASWTFEEAYAKYASSDEGTVFSRKKDCLPKQWTLLPLPKLKEGVWDTPFSFTLNVGVDGDDDHISIYLDVTRWEMYMLVTYCDNLYRESKDEISIKIIDAPLDVHDLDLEDEEI